MQCHYNDLIKNTFFLLFGLSLFIAKSGDKFDKSYQEADKLHHIGDYKRAIKAYKSIHELSPSTPAEKRISVDALTNLAIVENIYNGIDIASTEKNLERAISLSTSFFSPNSSAHTKTLINVSKVYTDLGKYKKAKTLINKAFSTKKDSKEVELAEAYLQYNIGYFNEAITTYEALNDYKKSTIKTSTSFLKKGKTITKELKGADLDAENRKYGNFLIEIAHLYFLKGDYNKALNKLTFAENWIISSIGKNDVSLVDLHFKKSKVYDALYKSDNALSEIKEALLTNERAGALGYMSSHITYLSASEQEMYFLWKSARFYNDLGKEANQARRVYHIKARNPEFYDQDGIMPLKNDLISLKKEIIKENSKSAIKKYIALEAKAEKQLNKTHPFLLEIYQIAELLYIENERIESLTELSNKIDFIADNNFVEGSPIYHKNKLNKAIRYFQFQDKFSEANKIFSVSFNQSVKKEYHPMHNSYLYYMNQYAALNALSNHFTKASAIYDDAIKITGDKNNFGGVDFPNTLQRLKKANFLIQSSRFNTARNLLNSINQKYDVDKISKEKRDFQAEALAKTNRALMKMAIGEQDYTNFEVYRKKYEKQMSNYIGKPERYDIDEILDFAPYYIANGNYVTVEKTLNDRVKQIKKAYSENDRRLIPIYYYLALIKIETGEYNQAEKFARSSESIILTKFGTKHIYLSQNALLKGKINLSTGDYYNAYHNLEKSLAIRESLIGKKGLVNAHIKGLHAMCKLYASQTDKHLSPEVIKSIENELLSAEMMIKEAFNNNSSKYNQSLAFFNHKFLETYFYININNITKAEDILTSLSNVKPGVLKETQRGEVALLKGQLFMYNKQYSEASKYLKEAQNIYKGLYSETHPKYVEALALSGQLAYIEGNSKKALEIAEKTTDIYFNYINTTFQYLSEKEKKDYWFNVLHPGFEFYKTLAFNDGREKYIKKVYNHTLNTKALLQSSSQKVKNNILKSNDQELIRLYKQWQESVKNYNVAITLDAQELSAEKIDLNNLQKEITALEKNLNEKSIDFKDLNSNNNITFKTIADKLNDNEYAIEIIRYNYFENSFTDSIIYAALIINNKSSAPKVVMLENGNNIEKRMVKYYRNVIRFKVTDEYSYNTFWKDIDESIPDGATIYLSTDGVFTKINVEAIPTPDNKYVIDKNKIVLVSNTKDILNNKNKDKNNKPKSAYIIGNPNYYVENSFNNPQHKNLNFRQHHSQLPGAEAEAQAIAPIFKKSNINTTLHIFNDVSERKFKKSAENKEIIHIATHGFFKDKTTDNTILSLDKNRALEDPLLRSGLLLKYGGDIADSLPTTKYNKYDGILTSNEVMNMNLENTELIILSACETGLGKNESGQGVYGLQRALSIAGVETQIMSLFKVNDKITKLLMEEFYKEYFKTLNKHQAFVNAKKKIKAEYKHPIYWASFIMIGK